MKPEIPDPDTEEGRMEIRRRLKRFAQTSKGHAERWQSGEDLEPGGKLSDPSELDLRRNLKHDD